MCSQSTQTKIHIEQGCGLVVECMTHMCEVRGSIPDTKKEKKEEKVNQKGKLTHIYLNWLTQLGQKKKSQTPKFQTLSGKIQGWTIFIVMMMMMRHHLLLTCVGIYPDSVKAL